MGGGDKARTRKRLAHRYGVSALPDGCLQIIFNYDASFAPCTCVTHRFVGVDCIVVAIYCSTSGELRRCVACGAFWPKPARLS